MPKKAVASESRRCLINVRTTEAMRKRLEEAAAASGRPLIHEIEHRLEVAFWLDDHETWEKDVFANADNRELAEALKLSVALSSRFAGSSWRDSPLARKMIELAVEKSLALAFDQLEAEQKALAVEGEDPMHLDRSASFIASLAVSQATRQDVGDEARAALREASIGKLGIGDVLAAKIQDN